ncbi:uncharacterized protein [Musca autumnalis]|uniref:uncharacterized protein n=1 Tax=Musca autumnalis TaxID=221902 RepID=UPI003CF7C6B0
MSLLERNNTADCILSSDELMLKELESRDGIYSFIFHELETTPATTTRQKMADSSSSSSRASCFIETPNAVGNYDHQQFVIYHIEEATAENITETSNTIKSENNTTATTNAPTSTNTFSNSLSPLNSTGGTFEVMKTTSVEFLKTWHPPSLLSFTCRFSQQPPQLFGCYSNNNNFRIRNATPRFSHVTVPLVRNRRHPLKDTPEYKKFPIENYTPDLRLLFPHDPDVHAPFAKEVNDTGLKLAATVDTV